jgi:conjugative relaxase-like TrwC/TraI family protein
VTVSFSKSISVFHASIREKPGGRGWPGTSGRPRTGRGVRNRFQEILQQANRAALEYAQRWAGVTRTGYHGTRVNGQEPGRFEQAGLVVPSWLQGTSRDGDPQDHIHNQIARIVRTVSDGRWRALDTACLRGIISALQAVAATAIECELTREFGVRWVPRPDGRGNEIHGITQAQMDAYSTRTVQVHAKERELTRAWERRHGRAPNSRELYYIAKDATLQSREGKPEGEIDWDTLARRWDATIGGELVGIAPAVSNARGPYELAAAADRGDQEPSGPEPAGQLSAEARVRVVQKALTLVSGEKPTWTRHELVRQLALVMPRKPGR